MKNLLTMKWSGLNKKIKNFMSQYFKVHSKYPMQVKLIIFSCHHLMSFNLQKSHGSNLMPVSSISSVLGVNSSVFAVRGPNYSRIVMGSAISKERFTRFTTNKKIISNFPIVHIFTKCASLKSATYFRTE